MNTDMDTRRRHLEKKAKELTGKDFLPGQLVNLVVAVARRQDDARMELIESGQFENLVAEHALPPTEQHLQGVPLLGREAFTPDHERARKLFEEFLELAAGTGEPLADAMEAFLTSVLPDVDLDEAFAAYVRADEEYFARWGERTPETPRLLAFLVQAALSPEIEAQAAALAPKLSADRAWQHGHCPVCGSLALISSLRNKEGQRFCTCSYCLTDYRVPRLACPFCGEDEPPKLIYFDVPDEPGYRIDACTTCSMYIKTADFRQLDKISVPALDDLESLPLDFLARERKFSRPTLSAWGF